MPLGSRGSFHRSEILSSDGVALTNSLGTGPGTTAQTDTDEERNEHSASTKSKQNRVTLAALIERFNLAGFLARN